MTAVLHRVRSALRRRWLSTVVVIALVAIVSAAVLACVVGARRTMSAPDRFTVASGGDFDATVTQQDYQSPRTSEIAGLPGVAFAESYTFVFGFLTTRSGAGLQDAFVFSGSARALGLRVVVGRLPNDTTPGEFVATRSFASTFHAQVGDHYDLTTLTPEQREANGYLGGGPPAGPNVDAVLVGLVEGPLQIRDPSTVALFSPALLRLSDVGIALSLISVRLDPGVDLETLRAGIAGMADGATFTIGDGRVVADDIRRAVNAQALGLWLLALVAGVASVVLLGQLISRAADLADDERIRLRSLGYTDRQALAEPVTLAAVPIVIGCAIGSGVATFASDIFPTGIARRVEPHAGLAANVALQAVGATLLILGLVAWMAVGVWVRHRPTASTARPSMADRLASASPSSTASAGMRLAFADRGPGRSAVRGPALAVVAGTALLIGAIVFGASLQRLLDDPLRYGVNYDLSLGDDGSTALPDGLLEQVTADPNVSSAVLYASDHGRIGSADVELLGMRAVRGDRLPLVVQGRLPVTDDEVAFGSVSAADVGAKVGDRVTIVGATGSHSFAVTGIAVLPGFGANDGVGSGALLTLPALRTLDGDAAPQLIAVSYASDPAGSVRRYVEAHPDDFGDSQFSLFRPDVIQNVAYVRSVPFVLAGLLALLSVITVVGVVRSAALARRRDVAVLRALGADGGWVSRVLHWQVSLLVVGPLIIGAVLGVIAGRQVFIAFADGMGAVDEPALPIAAVVLIVIGCLAVGNTAALWPARRNRRVAPATSLQAE